MKSSVYIPTLLLVLTFLLPTNSHAINQAGSSPIQEEEPAGPQLREIALCALKYKECRTNVWEDLFDAIQICGELPPTRYSSCVEKVELAASIAQQECRDEFRECLGIATREH
ncbi:MAG: hypothetical protein KDD66_06125 [Bdellovibrionales bacterium]|nr:hypothetical protein [Bdellovibrionales bacterium]